MIYTSAEKGDLPEIRSMWEYSFYTDSKAFLDFYFDRLDLSCVRLLKDGGDIAACLHLQDISLISDGINRKAAYIGGVSTAPEYRGQGCYKALMENTLSELQKNMYDAAMLIPFSFDFYRKSGFDVSSYYLEIRGNICDIKNTAPFKKGGSAPLVYQKYTLGFDSFWDRKENDFEYIAEGLSADGFHIFEGEGFCVIYNFRDGAMYIPELIYGSDSALSSALGFIRSHSSVAKKFSLRADLSASRVFSERCFEMRLCPHTMIKTLNPDFTIETAYNNWFNLLGLV